MAVGGAGEGLVRGDELIWDDGVDVYRVDFEGTLFDLGEGGAVTIRGKIRGVG